MKFHDYVDSFAFARRLGFKGDYHEYFEDALRRAFSRNSNDDYNQLITERLWVKLDRPYYNVFPKIVPHLLKVDEFKVPVESVKLPLQALVFRFSENCPDLSFQFKGETYYLKTVLVGRFPQANSKGETVGESLTIWIDIGEEENGNTVYTFQSMPIRAGESVGQVMQDLPRMPPDGKSVEVPDEFHIKVIRLVCSISMISTDIEDALIFPDVLNADKGKLDKASKQDVERFHDKAKRRGKFGWNVGEQLSVSPHIRAGCLLAVYWTGPGRTTKTLRPRKGCVVHRKLVKTLPTGFDPEEAQ